MRTALITGATGYAGSHLTTFLAEAGWNVRCLIRTNSDTGRLDPRANVSCYDGSIDSVLDCLASDKIDVVFHLASFVKALHEKEDVTPMINANILFGGHLLEAMRLSDCRQLINIGSYWEYDQYGKFSPNSLYAATKKAFQDIVYYYCLHHNIKAITLSLYDIYGPDDWRGKLIPSLLAAMYDGQVVSTTNGQQKLSLVYIDDVCRGLHRAAEFLEKNQEASYVLYGLFTDELIDLRGVVQKIQEIAGGLIKVRWGELEYSENQIFTPNLNIKKLPGWEPEFDLNRGIMAILSSKK